MLLDINRQYRKVWPWCFKGKKKIVLWANATFVVVSAGKKVFSFVCSSFSVCFLIVSKRETRINSIDVRQDMEYDSLLDRHFSSCDSDSNSFLDSLEWLRCLRSPRKKEERDEELENRRYGNGTVFPIGSLKYVSNFNFFEDFCAWMP